MARTTQKATKRKRVKVNPEHQSLSDYNAEVLQSGEAFSDVTIRTQNKDFKLHRVILARSGYFKNLFCGSWSDSGTNNVVNMNVVEQAIPELTPEIWQGVFHLLYTDECPDVSGLTIADSTKLIQLLKFFDLPIESTLKEMTTIGKLYALHCIGVLTASDEDETNDISEHQVELSCISEFEDCSVEQLQSDMEYVPFSFVQSLVEIPYFPLELKAKLLCAAISAHLKVNPEDDSSWRLRDEAVDYVKLVDSLDLHVLESVVPLSSYNLFSDQKFSEATNWDQEQDLQLTARSVAYQSFYIEANAKSFETCVLFPKIDLTARCDERSSAWWWDLSVRNNYEMAMKVKLYIRYDSNGLYNTRPALWRVFELTLESETSRKFYTVYGEQFDQSGMHLRILTSAQLAEEQE